MLLLKNGNKRSHNTDDRMQQVFINSMSELVKGSHKRPYVTLSHLPVGGILKIPKSKARRHSAGQHVNGGLAGEQGSKLPEFQIMQKSSVNTGKYFQGILKRLQIPFSELISQMPCSYR